MAQRLGSAPGLRKPAESAFIEQFGRLAAPKRLAPPTHSGCARGAGWWCDIDLASPGSSPERHLSAAFLERRPGAVGALRRSGAAPGSSKGRAEAMDGRPSSVARDSFGAVPVVSGSGRAPRAPIRPRGSARRCACSATARAPGWPAPRRGTASAATSPRAPATGASGRRAPTPSSPATRSSPQLAMWASETRSSSRTRAPTASSGGRAGRVGRVGS